MLLQTRLCTPLAYTHQARTHGIPCRPRIQALCRAQQQDSERLTADGRYPRVKLESQEEALNRRMKESKAVDERVKLIETPAQLENHLENAGDRLVILEVRQMKS